MDQKPGQKRGRPAKDGTAKTAAERKRDQRARDLVSIVNTDSTRWTVRQCLVILSGSNFPKDMQYAAWLQLGRALGFLKS